MTAAPDLELPLALSDPWEHALFLSYGLDLPFFERTILPNLAGSCRNRILLGDEKTYLASCDHFAESRLGAAREQPVRRGADSPAPKLTRKACPADERRGWLACGWQRKRVDAGIRIGGRAVHRLHATLAEDDANLAEFVAVRELLERLRDDDRLTRTAAWHVDQLLEGSPWLFRAASGASRVRHNLDTSFMDQLADAVGGEPRRPSLGARPLL